MDAKSGNENKLRISSKTRKVSRVFLFITGILIIFMSIHPCTADYDFDGVPEKDCLGQATTGIVKGGLYIDSGGRNGLGITPYVEEFNIPGDSVTWGRVYVGLWGGTEIKTGTLDLTVNGEKFETVELKGQADPGNEGRTPNIYCTGHGVYWIAYDLGTKVSPGPVKVEANTAGTIDGRVYGIVLTAVYEDNEIDDDTRYWVEEGNINLHGEGWSETLASTHEKAYANFFGDVDGEAYKTARLTVVYLCGSPGLDDSLYFNEKQLSNEGNKEDIANSQNYFDFKFFDVQKFLKNENSVTFVRDNEDYLHPVLATLCLGTDELDSEDNSSEISLNVTITPAISLEVSPSALEFGELSQGNISEPQNITLKNTGSCEIKVTAEVTDSSAEEGLFSRGMLLDTLPWQNYQKIIGNDKQENTVAALQVPFDYVGSGNKQGSITFWAEAAE